MRETGAQLIMKITGDASPFPIESALPAKNFELGLQLAMGRITDAGDKRADAARPDRAKRHKGADEKPAGRDRRGPSPEAKAASDRKLKKKLKKLTKKK